MTDYKEQIWAWLKGNTELTNIAIAGIMGNLECESNCEPCRMQGDFSANRQASRTYADLADSGKNPVSSYRSDGVGWGLAQWTYYTRKENLLRFCSARGKSIADLDSQLSFMLTESEYTSIARKLSAATTVYDAAKIFCDSFERPAVPNYQQRAEAGEKFYKDYHGTDVVETSPERTDNTEIVTDLLDQAMTLILQAKEELRK